jgi:hypothetical protein
VVGQGQHHNVTCHAAIGLQSARSSKSCNSIEYGHTTADPELEGLTLQSECQERYQQCHIMLACSLALLAGKPMMTWQPTTSVCANLCSKHEPWLWSVTAAEVTNEVGRLPNRMNRYFLCQNPTSTNKGGNLTCWPSCCGTTIKRT